MSALSRIGVLLFTIIGLSSLTLANNIDPTSCLDPSSCNGTNLIIGANSCLGVNSCNGDDLTIGERSCTKDDSCNANGTTVGDRACRGLNSCNGGVGEPSGPLDAYSIFSALGHVSLDSTNVDSGLIGVDGSGDFVSVGDTHGGDGLRVTGGVSHNGGLFSTSGDLHANGNVTFGDNALCDIGGEVLAGGEFESDDCFPTTVGDNMIPPPVDMLPALPPAKCAFASSAHSGSDYYDEFESFDGLVLPGAYEQVDLSDEEYTFVAGHYEIGEILSGLVLNIDLEHPEGDGSGEITICVRDSLDLFSDGDINLIDGGDESKVLWEVHGGQNGIGPGVFRGYVLAPLGAIGARSALHAKGALHARSAISANSAQIEFVPRSGTGQGGNSNIADRACNADNTCNGNNQNISLFACSGENSCNGDGVTVQQQACSAENTCNGDGIEIGAESCSGDGSCLGLGLVVGSEACTGNSSCVGSSTTISDNSCAASNSCNGDGTDIEDDACNGEGSCNGDEQNIPSMSCNQAGVCNLP